MKLDLPQKIDRKQWLERLGVAGSGDDQLTEQLDKAEAKLLDAASPRGVYTYLGVEDFYFSGEPRGCSWLELPGQAIRKHLDGCKHALLVAVTLGAGIDRIIRTSQIRDMAEAVILDAGASVLTEQVCDELGTHTMMLFGGHQTKRYSPGYGDFPIEMQARLLKALDAPKQIGLSVNESYIMTPRKSITAVIGLADHPVTGYMAACEECLLKESCELRKEGKKCWT